MSIHRVAEIMIFISIGCLVFVWAKLLRSGKPISKVYNPPRYIWSILDQGGRAALISGTILLVVSAAIFVSGW